MRVIDRIASSIANAGSYNSHDVVRPKVVLWPDGERLWKPVIGILRDAIPGLWSLGDYLGDTYTGPGAYLRYLLDKNVLPDGALPVIYLPGVSRNSFRSAADCPEEMIHLYALQFEGQFWTQKNGKDWTPFAFLSSKDGGLGLDVAAGQEARQALLDCLVETVESPVDELSGHKLEAADWRALATGGDAERMLLRWMSDPEAMEKEWSGARWSSFQGACKDDYQLDPAADGVLTAAEKLAAGKGKWKNVWLRFKEAPKKYPGIRKLLEQCSPGKYVEELAKQGELFEALKESYPSVNRKEEDSLREQLGDLANETSHSAHTTLAKLAAKHACRTGWVWADLGEAPLARAVCHLGGMAAAIKNFGEAATWEDWGIGYARSGWKIDAEALLALAGLRQDADMAAVAAALRALYVPWLEKTAFAVQAIAGSYPNPGKDAARQLPADAGCAYVFVDGLRFDLGQMLAERLKAHSLKVDVKVEWAALPSVTATAKPAWTPLGEKLNGGSSGEKFQPSDNKSGKPMTAPRFRQLLGDLGFQVLSGSETGDPGKAAWTEAGYFDKYGHDQGWKLSWRLDEEFHAVTQRVRDLIQAGYTSVNIITDHGWLLAPGGLPKTQLPKHLTTSRWGRCASPQPGAVHNLPQIGWFWDNTHSVVLAPGISAFMEGVVYTHGGLSLQETLLPRVTVSALQSAALATPEVQSMKWKGMRLTLQVSKGAGLAVDLRRKVADANTTILTEGQRNRLVPETGEVSLLVENDDLLGEAVQLVLLTAQGQAVLKDAVTIGED